jgi:hypothetical protein
MTEKAGLAEGIPIILEAEKDTIVICKKVYDLETLLSQVTPHNIHVEMDTGPGGESGVEKSPTGTGFCQFFLFLKICLKRKRIEIKCQI